jgi:hypothetical protein
VSVHSYSVGAHKTVDGASTIQPKTVDKTATSTNIVPNYRDDIKYISITILYSRTEIPNVTKFYEVTSLTSEQLAKLAIKREAYITKDSSEMIKYWRSNNPTPSSLTCKPSVNSPIDDKTYTNIGSFPTNGIGSIRGDIINQFNTTPHIKQKYLQHGNMLDNLTVMRNHSYNYDELLNTQRSIFDICDKNTIGSGGKSQTCHGVFLLGIDQDYFCAKNNI